MKAVQIKKYAKHIHTILNEVPKPHISDSEVLVRVKAAAANPVEVFTLDQANDALRLVAQGPLNGKVIIQF